MTERADIREGAVGRAFGLLRRELEARAERGEITVARRPEAREHRVGTLDRPARRRARRAQERVDDRRGHRRVDQVGVGVVEDAHLEIQGVEERPLLQIIEHPSMCARAVVVVERRGIDIPVEEIGQRSRGEALVSLVIVVQAQADLLEIVDALDPSGGLAGALNRGQQQGDQDGDDRDHDEQLNQGEPAPGACDTTRRGDLGPGDFSRDPTDEDCGRLWPALRFPCRHAKLQQTPRPPPVGPVSDAQESRSTCLSLTSRPY